MKKGEGRSGGEETFDFRLEFDVSFLAGGLKVELFGADELFVEFEGKVTHIHKLEDVDGQNFDVFYVVFRRILPQEESSDFDRPRVHLFCHSIIQSFSHSIIQSFNHSFIQSFNHSIIQSFNHSII